MCEMPGCDGHHGWPREDRYGVTASVNRDDRTDIITTDVNADSPNKAVQQFMREWNNPDVVHAIVIKRDHLGSYPYTAKQIRALFGPAKKPTVCPKCEGTTCPAHECIWEDDD